MAERIEDLLKHCTVKLSVPGKVGWGTGFFVAPGKILTCAHVVKDAETKIVNVCWQNQENFTQATITQVFSDPVDLALLDFNPTLARHPCVYLDPSPQPEDLVYPDDHLFTYGYSDDFPHGTPVTDQCEGLTGDQPSIIKFKAGQIRPGLSGSPLLNQRTGKVGGIVKFTRDRSFDLGGGAIPTSTVFQYFPDLDQLQAQFHRQDRRWRNLMPAAKASLWKVASMSFGFAFLVVFVRFLGVLQPLELKTYDHLMRSRIEAGADDRLRIIAIDQADVAAQEARGENLDGSSLSNESLAKLLEKLERLQVRTIGLDLYRDDIVDKTQQAELIHRFQTQPNLFATCKTSYEDQRGTISEIPPPPGFPDQRVGFSDFVVDSDDVLRRHLLAFQPPTSSSCNSEISFSLQVAGHYLAKEGIEHPSPLDGKGHCQGVTFSNGVTLPMFRPYTGGYQGELSYGGCQVLLNYRPSTNVAKQFSLEQALQTPDTDLADDFEDRIVLIGMVHRDLERDDWSTPFGRSEEQKLTGVIIQAHMVSQILSAVVDGRPSIWVLPFWGDALWIWFWALVGGLIGRQSQYYLRHFGMWLSVASISIYLICLLTFHFQGWLPLLPSILSLLMTGTGVWWLTLRLHIARPSTSHPDRQLSPQL
jgi:CHASE2 domain-containing sensor protein